jgi:RyR domain
VLVLGAGQLGSALISQLARERYERLRTSPDLGPVRVNLVDRVAFERAAALTDRYSRLSEACSLRTFELDVESPAFDRLLERNPELAEVDAAFVCFDDDSVGIAAALSLLEQARGRFPVIARVTSRSEGIAGLIQEAHSGHADATTFLPVSVAERACHADLVLGGMRAQLAREVHETYLGGRTDGRPRGPYDVPWEELTEEGRRRNFRQADAIRGQLRAAGYRLGPLLDWGAALEELTPEEVELVSELEHERWMAERVREGWTFGAVRDDKLKQHPDLRPWSELPTEQQDINRRFVRERIAMLARVGIQVYRA